jgi:hypothetical protein
MHRNYTFEELAGVFGVHKNTIANWVKDGLPCLKERRPFLILGQDAREFLKAQRVDKKRLCKPNEFYCETLLNQKMEDSINLEKVLPKILCNK